MEFTLLNKMARLKSMFFIAILLLSFQSCKKSDSDSVSGELTTVKVKLSVGSPEEERIAYGSNKSTTKVKESNVQLSNVQISDNMSMEVMVIRDVEPSAIRGTSGSNNAAKAATQTVTNTLTPGVKYRIMVYDNGGAHKGNYDYIYGSEPTTGGIQSNAGETYTFVVYSVNSTSDLPDASNQGSLSTASLSNISSDLMFFKKTLTLNHGDNNLNAILVHKFSQITTTIEMDDSMTGSIEAISNTRFSPTKASGSLKFSDESLSFPNANGQTNVTFPAITPGLRTITSNPTFLISKSVTDAIFTFGSITLDAETKTGIEVKNVKITPGHKYNLVLRFRACTQNVTSDALNWRYEEATWTTWDFWNGLVNHIGIIKDGKRIKNNEIITNSFSAPQANYGFQFDITELDNAFNMRVNNQYIFGTSFSDQIQFQTNTKLGTQRNIVFEDGTEYATNDINEVFHLKGTLEKPLIRIMISRTGEVTMLGSKTNEGPLVPLRLKGGKQFNKVNWSATGPNTVVVSQKVDGRTIVIGKGYGRKRINCPN